MSWFEKLMPSRISTEKRTRSVPQGVWMKCPDCDEQLIFKGGRSVYLRDGMSFSNQLIGANHKR